LKGRWEEDFNMTSRLTKRLGTGVVLAAAFALVLGSSSPAAAGVLTATDLNDILDQLDTLVAGPAGSDFLTPSTYIFGVKDFGDLTNAVYQDDESLVYTYIHVVDPADASGSPPDLQSVARFATAFDPLGFDSSTLLAGWDFDAAFDADGVGDATERPPIVVDGSQHRQHRANR
jgi:hypothetical protein